MKEKPAIAYRIGVANLKIKSEWPEMTLRVKAVNVFQCYIQNFLCSSVVLRHIFANIMVIGDPGGGHRSLEVHDQLDSKT